MWNKSPDHFLPIEVALRTLDYMANGVTAQLSCLVLCGSAHILNPAAWLPERRLSQSAWQSLRVARKVQLQGSLRCSSCRSPSAVESV